MLSLLVVVMRQELANSRTSLSVIFHFSSASPSLLFSVRADRANPSLGFLPVWASIAATVKSN